MPVLSKAAFLDRDGVINQELDYVYKIEDFHFIDGVFNACRRLQQLDYKLIIVTNQSGIGRQYYTESDFQRLTEWMLQQFTKHGVQLTAVYHCPYHPEHGVGEYRRESPYRKPGPQMLLDAAVDHGIDLHSSFMVGDHVNDLRAARAAGVARVFFIGRSESLSAEFSKTPVYNSLYELVQTEFGQT